MMYTVLLLYPDYLSHDYGHETYCDSTEASDPTEAVAIIRVTASEGKDIGNLDDWHVLFVCEGDATDIKDQVRRDDETVNLPLTNDEVKFLSVTLMNVSDDTSSNAQAAKANAILTKLRHA